MRNSTLAQPDRDLLHRIRAGDREAAAEFAMRFGPMIRRRIGGKLGPHLRRTLDSHDIVSTVMRRLDMYVRSGRVKATSESELWALIMKIAQNAVIDKVRVLKRLEAVEGSDAVVARALLNRARHDGEPDETLLDQELERAVLSLESDVDRTILWMWLTGREHRFSAALLGMSVAAVRKRWERVRSRLRDILEDDSAP